MVAPIEADDTGEATESLEQAGGLRELPAGVETGLTPSDEHDVVGAGTMDLVRDPEVAAARIPSLRSVHQIRRYCAARSKVEHGRQGR